MSEILVNEEFLSFVSEVRSHLETLYLALVDRKDNTYSVTLGRLMEVPGVVGVSISEYVVDVDVQYSGETLLVTYMDYDLAKKSVLPGVELEIIDEVSTGPGFLVDGKLVEGIHFEVKYPSHRNSGGN